MSLSRLLLVLALSSASVAFAQDGPTTKPAEPAQPAEPAPAPEQAPVPEAKKKKKRGKRGKGVGARLGQLKEDLELDPATMATLREQLGEIDKERRSRMKELRQAGAEKSETKKLAKEYRKQAAAKLREILGDERYKTWRGKEKERRQAAGKGKRGKGGKNAKRGKNRRAVVSKDQVLKQLKLGDEEAAVVGPLIDGLLETEKLLGQAQAERKKAFAVAALASDDDEALTKLLETYRKEKAEDEKTIAKARESFREVLSPGQEAKAVALGLLN